MVVESNVYFRVKIRSLGVAFSQFEENFHKIFQWKWDFKKPVRGYNVHNAGIRIA
jgi:hypothetical protein